MDSFSHSKWKNQTSLAGWPYRTGNEVTVLSTPRTIRVSIKTLFNLKSLRVAFYHLQVGTKKKLTVMVQLFQLEKEAEAKGIPVCQALNIEIPPPRPKRKPNTPYPRKPGNNGPSSSQVPSTAKLVSSASSSQCNQAFLDL